MAGVSPAAPYRHFRDRDELLSSIAQRGFEQFEAVLTAGLGRRASGYRHGVRAGRQGLSRVRPRGAGVLFGDVRIGASGRPQSDIAGGKRARLRHHQGRGGAACRAGAAGHAAPAGDDDGAAYLVDVAWRGVAVRARRCGAPQAADVGGGSAGSRGADLSARSRVFDRPQAAPAQTTRRSPNRPGSLPGPGAPQNKLPGAPGGPA